MMDLSWASLFLRSAVILGSAEVIRRLLRRASPGERHRLVMFAFLLLLVWPLLSVLLPKIPIPLLRPVHTGASVAVEQAIISGDSEAAIPRAFPWALAIWVAGFVAALTPLFAGYLRLHRIVRRAAPLRQSVYTLLAQELCGELGLGPVPQLLTVSEPVVPLTFGWRKPRILLPIECTEWSASRRRIVLLHELAHVKRRDTLARILASLIAALWWFQPLSWTSRWTLRRESERATDAMVIAAGIRPSDYASELLGIAQALRRGQRCCPAAVAMARRGDLEGRVAAILRPQPRDGALRIPWAAISALSLLAITASAITLSSSAPVSGPRQLDPKGGSTMKRSLFSGLLATATLSAATIGGSLFDPSGTAIPNATASLYNPDTSAKQETTTDSNGKFAFESLAAGQYILHIEKQGFASLYREFNVQPDSNVERGLVLKLSNDQVNSGTRVATAQTLNPGQIRVGGTVAQANLINKVQPVYPPSAKTARLQGTVELEVAISAEGVPEDIRVLSSPGDDLTQSALDAVRQWRYRPTLLNGNPVPIVTEVIVNYTLAK